MVYSMGGVGGFGDKSIDNSVSNNQNIPQYKRFSGYQRNILQKFMARNSHPNEAQRNQLAKEVGLEPKQIKHWFDNKKTILKKKHTRADNKALHAEKKELNTENIVLKKILKIPFCESCGGPSFPMHKHERFMQKMRMENDMLKKKIEKMSILLARYEQKEISQLEFEHAFARLNAFSRLEV